MQYSFDWDPAKEKANIRKHQVSFRRAATIFRDPNQLSIYDEEHSEAEERWVSIGIDSDGVLRVVVHTFEPIGQDSCEIRIISARKATHAEVEQYEEKDRAMKDMKEQYDFSKGERKFYHPGAAFSFPVYLEPDIDDYMSRLAEEKGIELQKLVNEWLRASIQLIRSVQQDD